MLFDYGDKNFERKKNASSGNRTRAARVAGEHSTTEPRMLGYHLQHGIVMSIYTFNAQVEK